MKVRGLAIVRAAVAASVLGSGASALHAAAYTWNSTSAGNWTDTSATGWNTDPSPAYPTLAGDSATITQALTATTTVTINVSGVTVGSLSLAGATQNNGGGSTTDKSWRVARTSAYNLTFDTLSGNAALASNGGQALVSAPVVLNKDLDVTVTGTTSDGWGGTPAAGLTLSGAVSGNASIYKAGSGLLTLSTANTFVGGININAGSILAKASNSLGNTANVVTVASGGRLDVGPGSGTAVTLANPITINGTGPSNSGALRYAQWGGAVINGPVTLGSNSLIAHSARASNQITFNGGINVGSQTLTFQGANYASGDFRINTVGIQGTGGSIILSHGGSNGSTRLTLSAASSYTGSTTINHTLAYLYLNSSITSNVLVNAGHLRGNGTINAANTTTIGNGTGTADAILNPGSAGSTIGTLTTGPLSFNADGRYAPDIDSSAVTADRVSVFGNVSIAANTSIVVTDLAATAVDLNSTSTSFTILQSIGGNVSGTFAGYPEGALLAVTKGAVTNNFYVHYQPDRVVLSIPEPASIGLLAASASLLAVRRRSRVR